MRFLGETLARRGFPVHAVQLAGHGTRVEDMVGTRWTDWFASAAAGLKQLGAEVPRVAVVGMSMGALLALHCAATQPDAVAGLVLCGTPFLLTDSRLRWLPLVARFRGAGWRARLLPKPNGPDVADPATRAVSRSYLAMPLAAVLELLRLRAVVRAELGRVRQPALLLHGRNDHSAPVTNLELLRQKLGSRDVEVHVLERSWHVVTVDYDREEVARLTVAFLDRVDAAPGD